MVSNKSNIFGGIPFPYELDVIGFIKVFFSDIMIIFENMQHRNANCIDQLLNAKKTALGLEVNVILLFKKLLLFIFDSTGSVAINSNVNPFPSCDKNIKDRESFLGVMEKTRRELPNSLSSI